MHILGLGFLPTIRGDEGRLGTSTANMDYVDGREDRDKKGAQRLSPLCSDFVVSCSSGFLRPCHSRPGRSEMEPQNPLTASKSGVLDQKDGGEPSFLPKIAQKVLKNSVFQGKTAFLSTFYPPFGRVKKGPPRIGAQKSRIYPDHVFTGSPPPN